MTDTTVPFCVEPGWVRADVIENIGPLYRLLTYEDGTVRFEHRCDRGKRGVIIAAPRLQTGRGHTVTYQAVVRPDLREAPTVTPSILCDDCGTHGFITSGRWSDA